MKHAWRHWLWKLLACSQKRKASGPRRARLGLEALEDRTLPSLFLLSITCATPSTAVTNASTIAFTVTFNEAAVGVSAANFQPAVTGTVATTLTQVTPVSPSVYTVTVNGVTGNGTVGLNLVNDTSIHDLAGDILQSPPAAFQAQQTFATGSQPRSVALADVNGDGIPDLVVANEGSNTVSVLLGNGNGTFQAQQTFATGNDPAALAIDDVNGDGKPDIVVVNANSDTVSVLLGNGNGTFQAQLTFAVGTFDSDPTSVVLGDVNGDGKPDIVVANHDYNTVNLLLGNGNGTFQPQLTLATGYGASSVALGDLSSDGKPDIVLTNEGNDTVSVLMGNGDGTFQPPQTFAAGTSPVAAALADVNGNGIPDLVVADEGSGTVSVLMGNGDGTFQTPETFAAGTSPTSVVVGDVNGDGLPDLVVGHGTVGETVSVLPGNGNGTFGNPQQFASGFLQYSLALGDVGGDGKLDIVAANFDGDTVSILLNTDTNDLTLQAFTISPAANTHFIVTAPICTTTGNAFVFTVTALDASGNPAAGYTGTVHFSSTDTQASLPADAGLFNGTGVFAAVLNTLGTQSITVNDTAMTSDTATSGPITVIPPATASFSITATLRSIRAGIAVVFEVNALDAKNNVIPDFSGTVHFSSSDSQASLPTDATLTNGIGFFTAILKTAGRQTLSVSDFANGGATGTSLPIAVSAVAASHLGMSAPTAAVTGNAFSFTVSALDPYGNVVSNYAGTVRFTSSDSAAVLPASTTLAAGVGIFTATLNTSGNDTLSAGDTANVNIAGVTKAIAARGLAVSSFIPTPTGFDVVFDKAFNPTTLSLYVGTADLTLFNQSGQLVRGSLVLNTAFGAAPDTSFTFIATDRGVAGLLAAGTYTVTIAGGPSGLNDSGGDPGVSFVTTFTVAAASGPVLSIPDFARGPNSSANILLPNNMGSGIPITLSNAVNVTDVTFTLSYNPTLLNISGVSSGPSGILTLLSNTGGVASFSFHNTTPLNGTLTLGNIIAQVPNSAASSYKSKVLLHLDNIVINGSINNATGSDGIEAVAYLGDVAGTGSFSPLDAALMGQVAVNVAAGFAAYPLLDPAIVGNVSGSGSGEVDSADVTLMNRLLAGIAEPKTPLPPSSLSIPATGPDPTLSLPANPWTTTADTITVPVNIDTARPAGSGGLMEATLALRYDPQLFSVTAADIKLGTVPSAGSGWQLVAAINPETGEIGISLFSTTPVQSAAGGSLVTITLQVKDTAAIGQVGLSLVDEVDPTGLHVFRTGLVDGLGALRVNLESL